MSKKEIFGPDVVRIRILGYPSGCGWKEISKTELRKAHDLLSDRRRHRAIGRAAQLPLHLVAAASAPQREPDPVPEAHRVR
jgi:hypothetical protein